MKEKIKLDLKDWKILNQLDLDSRQSENKIAKKVRLSKQVVNYRIKRLIDEGIITGFYPHINVAKLGFGAHKVYLQLRALTKEKEEKMWDYLIKQPNIIWVISCSGKWDIIFAILSRDIGEFDEILSDFMNKFSDNILNREITVFNKASLHHRKWLLKEKQKPVYWWLGGKIEETKIDNTDKKILRLLDKDARMPIIDIAKHTGLSNSSIIQRINRLQEKGIIGAFRLGLNRKKLNINYCKSFVYYQNKTTEKENQVLEYCYNIPNVLGVSKSIGPWDLELEFEVKNYDDFHNIMREMKNKFSLIRSFETVYIEKEYGGSFLPGDF